MARKELARRLVDVAHWRDFEGQALAVHTREGGGATQPPHVEQVLTAALRCTPYAGDGRPQVPVVDVQVSPDCWMADLDPDAVAALAAKLHAQADRLNHEVRPALVEARDNWAAGNGGSR